MSFADYGIGSAVSYLEQLLSFALGADARKAADALVRRYGTLDLIASASIEELERVDGMTRSAAVLISLTGSLTSRRITDGFTFGLVPTEEELKRYIVALYLGVSVETVYLILFDGEGRALSLEYVGEGTVSASDIYPRRLLEIAIRRGASSAVLVHNHPRASGSPSREDVSATKRISEAFRSAGVQLRAHYIVSERNVSRVSVDDSCSLL